MDTLAGRLAVAAFSIAALVGCSDSSTNNFTAQAGPGPTASIAGLTGSPEHFCAGTKQPPPEPSLTFSADGHAGNEWTMPVEADGVTVRFTISQRPSTAVASMRFVIVPAKAPYPGGEIRTFAPAGENWTPGEHTATVTWDGRDGDGRPVATGRYHLFGEAITTTTRGVTCADGSGKGIEEFSGAHEGAGLGRFSVRPREVNVSPMKGVQAT